MPRRKRTMTENTVSEQDLSASLEEVSALEEQTPASLEEVSALEEQTPASLEEQTPTEEAIVIVSTGFNPKTETLKRVVKSKNVLKFVR